MPGGENSTCTTANSIPASGTVTRCGFRLPPRTSATSVSVAAPTRASKRALPFSSGDSTPGRSVTFTLRPRARRQWRSSVRGRSMPGVVTSSRYGVSPKSPASSSAAETSELSSATAFSGAASSLSTVTFTLACAVPAAEIETPSRSNPRRSTSPATSWLTLSSVGIGIWGGSWFSCHGLQLCGAAVWCGGGAVQSSAN